MNHYRLRSRDISGFSLVELMLVISIMAILAGAIGFAASESREQGRDAQRQSDLQTMKASIETYRQQNGRYPAMGCTPVDGWSMQQDCLNFIDGLNEIMSQIPRDPSSGSGDGYVYRTNTDGTVYKLMARGSAEQTVTGDHPLQACDRTLCTASCTGSANYEQSFAVWGGFADASTEAAVRSETSAVICAM